MNSGRRNFIKKSLLASFATAAFPIILSADNPANEKLIVGLIGADFEGFQNLKYFLNQPNVECGAIYDSDKNILEKRAADTEKIQKSKPLIYNSYNSLLENNDIDIVINSVTTDSKPLIAACEAGKSVYTKLPLNFNEEELNTLKNLQKSKGNVVQTDHWINSTDELQQNIKQLQSGNFGEIKAIHAWNYAANPSLNYFNSTADACDYLKHAANKQNIHLLYTAFSCLNEKTPFSVFSTGGNYSYPLKTNENPDSMMTVFDFDTFKLLWDRSASIRHQQFNRTKGVVIICTTKTLLIDEKGWQVFPGSKNNENLNVEFRKFTKRGIDRHIKNFLEDIKNEHSTDSRFNTIANASKANDMANKSYRNQQKLEWL